MSDIASTIDSKAKLASGTCISPIKEAPAFQMNCANQQQANLQNTSPGDNNITQFTPRRVEEQCHACHKYGHPSRSCFIMSTAHMNS